MPYYNLYLNVSFKLRFIQNQQIHELKVSTYRLRKQPGTFTTLLNDYFAELNIPITVSLNRLCTSNGKTRTNFYRDYIIFKSSEIGFSFLVEELIITPIKSDYENFDKCCKGDYSDSPFNGPVYDFNYIANLIRSISPRRIGEDVFQTYKNIPCQLHRYVCIMCAGIQTDVEKYK